MSLAYHSPILLVCFAVWNERFYFKKAVSFCHIDNRLQLRFDKLLIFVQTKHMCFWQADLQCLLSIDTQSWQCRMQIV